MSNKVNQSKLNVKYHGYIFFIFHVHLNVNKGILSFDFEYVLYPCIFRYIGCTQNQCNNIMEGKINKNLLS